MVPKQRGQSVTIAPPEGIAGNDVGYGVVLNGVASPEDGRMSIDDITRQLVRDLEQNAAMQPTGNMEPITVAGIQGRSVELNSISPFPAANGQHQREQDWLVTAPQRDGSIIFLIFVAPQSQFDRFEPTFKEMFKSVQF
jgi:hypothetical protein